jgi:hypothetical protein
MCYTDRLPVGSVCLVQGHRWAGKELPDLVSMTSRASNSSQSSHSSIQESYRLADSDSDEETETIEHSATLQTKELNEVRWSLAMYFYSTAFRFPLLDQIPFERLDG